MSRAIYGAVLFCLAATPSLACEPYAVSSSIQDAQLYLRSAAMAETVDEGAGPSGRAATRLADAESQLRLCQCYRVASEFGDAASAARGAAQAYDGPEFTEYLRRSIRNFNSGVEALDRQRC